MVHRRAPGHAALVSRQVAPKNGSARSNPSLCGDRSARNSGRSFSVLLFASLRFNGARVNCLVTALSERRSQFNNKRRLGAGYGVPALAGACYPLNAARNTRRFIAKPRLAS